MTMFTRAGSRAMIGHSAGLVALASCAAAQWTQWGGPQRNFQVEAHGLADEWPTDGPKVAWKRELGDGYSSILAEDGVLYTMYRTGEDEFTIALKAADGQTVWQRRNPSPFTDTMAEFGPGPHATPLIVENRLYSIGTNATLQCFDKTNGEVQWRHDLIEEYAGELRARGYSCSPLAYKQMLIVPLGSESDGPGALAFDQKSGDVIWRAPTNRATYAAPLLIRFGDQDQVVLFMASELVAVNPDTGAVLWTFTHRNNTSVNASTPVWDGKDTLFCSNAYDGGARAIRLTRAGDKVVPNELWHSNAMKLQHGNALLLGDMIFASSGMQTAFLMGLRLSDGEVLFRERGFSKATCLQADGKVILLDEDGQMALAHVTPEGVRIRSKCDIAEPFAWAAPTLAGTTLYVRDRKHIMALDLAAAR